MDKYESIAPGVALGILAIFVIGMGVGFEFGEDSGRKQVASGQYSCQMENETTSWKCEEKEDE